MHELSIAEALLAQVRRHAPPGPRVLSARVEIGARQSIDPDALRFAWQALTISTDLEDSTLDVVALPWDLRCTRCGRAWTSTRPLERCSACNSEETEAAGTNDLRLISLEVSDTPQSPNLNLNLNPNPNPNPNPNLNPRVSSPQEQPS